MRHKGITLALALADYKCAETVAHLSTVQAMQARHARYFPKAYASALAKLTCIDARALRIAKTLHLQLTAGRGGAEPPTFGFQGNYPALARCNATQRGYSGACRA